MKRFVQQVILGAEFGSKDKVAARWMTAPILSVFGASLEQKQVVGEVVKTINQALAPSGLSIQITAENSPSATMRVYFISLQDFTKVARENGFRPPKNNIGLFWMFWNDRHVITRSVVLLASDRLKGDQLKHFAFEEITQALGLAQDSDEFQDSIFYERGADGGAAVAPSALDLQLLGWFYQNVQPGDTRRIVSTKFEETWP